MGSLSDKLAALSSEKRELLRRRLMTADGEWIASRIPRTAKNITLRPSFAQSRLWFDQQWDPESPAYNVARFVRLKGHLNTDLMLQCFHDVQQRHEVLRSRFRQENGELVQSIAGPEATTIGFRDLSHLSGDQQADVIARFVNDEAKRPFRLDSEPLLRQTLLKLSESEHVIVFVVHHIVFDGWSGRVYFGQVLAEYEIRLRDPQHRLSDIPLQYADYAHWQRDQLTSPAFQAQLEYWRRQLAGMPDHLALPTDWLPPLTRSFRGAIHTFEIPQHLVGSLKELGRQHDATLYMTTLASFVTLLFRYSSQDDVVVGTPITTRTKPELEDLVGMFVNTLVLRTPVEGTLTFRQLLERVRKVTLEASENRDYPFEKLIEELHPERGGRRTPLVQAFFDLQRRQPVPAPRGFEIDEVTHIDTETAMFDLSLALEETDQGLTAVLGYSTDLFEQSTVVRMASHYLTLLEGVTSDADRELRQLALLGEVEREQVTVEWCGSVATVPTGKCVPELFEEQARRAPELIAVGCGTETLTYGELNRRSNQLACYLKRRGVGPEVLVGVCMDRSIDWVVALMGILKAGGAHVSLDPTYPTDRLAFMLSDASVAMLITTRALLGKVAASSGDVLCLDEEWHRIAEESDSGVEPSATWDNAAYVVYTSGSSGRPKGVVNIHRGVFNLTWWHRTTFNVSTEDRACQVARMGFDASVWEIWSYLTSGASLWIVDDDTRYSPAAMLAWLREKRITIGWLPPALGEAVFQEPEIASLGMRILFGGSDRAVQRPPDDAQFVYHNPYGPTEATVIVTHGRLAPTSLDSGPIHVGRTIVNNQIYVLDDQLQPVPIGVAGQIYIGGAHLARGYLNDPALTAAKFIPHPFSVNGERLYATGDLGRFLSDGRIHVLGRIDDQVKIRGFRVELGEIEQALVGHPAVREAIVIAREESHSGKHLVAYVVPDLAENESKTGLSALEDERVEQWRFLYEQTYNQTDADAFVGWNSSYSGAPIPADEMLEWRDATVARIRALEPNRVLEIGCGTGLLLSVIAREIESYCATDFSRTSLDQLRNRLSDDVRFERVNLLERMADDFTGLAENSFDVVILNSVVQYFPDLDYLLRVLDGAIRVVRDGGAIFIGDVRNFRLLDTLHTSIEVHRAQRGAQLAEVRQRALRGASNEEELLIDPMFFPALSDRFPEVSNVEIRLKRGRRHNELNSFRYDVTLRIGGSWRSADAIPELDWKQDGLTMVALESLLGKDRPQELAIRDIPNARLAGDVRAADVLIHNADSPTSLTELRELQDEARQSAIDPETACELLEQLGYDVDLSWSRSGKEECFDLFLRIRNHQGEQTASFWHVNGAPLSSYANNPLRPLIAEGLLPRIRFSLEEKLPEYMIPSAFVFLDSLPINSNGKVDRKSLPAPGPLKARPNSRPPRTDVERGVAQIWAETLGITQSGRNGPNGQFAAIGIDDNLFELGGHSLMVAQIVSRLRDAFSVELPLRTVFENPTVAEVAAEIEALRWGIEYLHAPLSQAGLEIEEGEV